MDLRQPDEAKCWAKARELIEGYGDDVSAFLDLMRSRIVMTAPIVPNGVRSGIGMICGCDAGTP